MIESDWLVWFPDLATDWSGSLACLNWLTKLFYEKPIEFDQLSMHTCE